MWRCMQDIAELEAAVAENLLPLEAVGAPHRALRAFRALLFAPTAALVDSLLLPALPRSTVLHHLYSRAPLALQSPHSRSGFSPAQVCAACHAGIALCFAGCTLKVNDGRTHFPGDKVGCTWWPSTSNCCACGAAIQVLS